MRYVVYVAASVTRPVYTVEYFRYVNNVFLNALKIHQEIINTR